MTATERFFYDQTDLTAAKITIYRHYLENYLPKVLIQYGKCFLADFFCGPGKNGEKDGSPLVLLDCASRVLTNPTMQHARSDAEMVISFSDVNKDSVENLKSILKSFPCPSGVKMLDLRVGSFQEIAHEDTNFYKKIKEPKFFFLDPFGYSTISINDVKKLMDCPAAEVLMFLPTFHSFRFHKGAENVPALKSFLTEFTMRGCVEYRDIDDLNESIRQKISSCIGLDFVRAIKLDEGKRKNALFHVTRHVLGALMMNDLAWKYSKDGVGVALKDSKEDALFDLRTTSAHFSEMERLLINFLAKQKKVTNVEIILFVAKIGFTCSYARKLLSKLKKDKQLTVDYPTKQQKGFYVANDNWNKKLAVIKYLG